MSKYGIEIVGGSIDGKKQKLSHRNYAAVKAL